VDQNPGFFVSKGVMPGIARTFVENIRDWVETVKKVIPILEGVYYELRWRWEMRLQVFWFRIE
jgi:hypothetical protein